MLLKDYQYEHAVDVPFEGWEKFDREKDKIIEIQWTERLMKDARF